MQLSEYLNRIGYHGHPEPDLETLTAIHQRHLATIPYENLDVQLGRRLSTDVNSAFEKIVERGRGGWCYEMNGLLGWALTEIGFDIKRVCGGVARTLRGDSAMGNHLVLLTELEGQTWIVDTGFGDGFYEPVPLKPHEFTQRGFQFRLEKTDDGYWRLHNHENGGAPDFDFSTEPADESLLSAQCKYLQTAEESPFVMALICQLFTDGGYEIQLGRMAKTITADGAESKLLNSAEEFVERLNTVFDLDVPEAARLWPRVVERHETLFGNTKKDEGSDRSMRIRTSEDAYDTQLHSLIDTHPDSVSGHVYPDPVVGGGLFAAQLGN